MDRCNNHITIEGNHERCVLIAGHRESHRFVVGPEPYPDIFVMAKDDEPLDLGARSAR